MPSQNHKRNCSRYSDMFEKLKYAKKHICLFPLFGTFSGLNTETSFFECHLLHVRFMGLFLWQPLSRATQIRLRRFWHQNTQNDPLFWEGNSDIEIGAGLQSLSIINKVPKKQWCFALFYICKTTSLEKYGEVCRNVNVKRAFERFSLEIIRASHEICQQCP